MRFIFIIIILGLSACNASKDLEIPGDNYFIKYYGDDGNQKGIDLEVDSDGNTYLLGISDSLGSSDGKERQLYLVKTDSKGILIWSKTFGTNYTDNARDLLLTKDNNLVVLANSFNSAGNWDIYIYILDLNGAFIKSTVFNFAGYTYNEYGNSISETNDGYIVAGSTDYIESKASSTSIQPSDTRDGLLLRLNSDLTLYPDTWRKKNGSEYDDVIVNLIQNQDGNFSMFGFTNKPLTNTTQTNYKFWVRALNSFGEALGNELLINGSATSNYLLNSVISVSDGYLLAGQDNDLNTSQLVVSKLYKNLTLNNTAITSGADLQLSLNLDENSTKNVVVSPATNSDYYLFSNANSATKSIWYLNRQSTSGSGIWPTPVYFSGENSNYIGSMKVLSNSKLLMTGTMAVGGKTSEYKMTLVKVNSSGKFAN